MAQTSININFEIGSNGSPTTLVTTLSNKTKSCDFTRTQDLPDVTAFNNSGAKAFAMGLNEGEFGLEFQWDATVDAHLNGLIGYATAVNFQYGPDGSTSGYPKYTGTLFVTNVSQPSTVGAEKMISATFKPTGTITRGTFA